MSAIILLLGALALARAKAGNAHLALALVLATILIAVVAGLTLPDIDLPLPLDHRSAVTHSVLPALLLTIRRWVWPVATGLALGIGLHLAADVFPNAMIGFATVKMPFAGSIGRDHSYQWLIANALAATALGGWLSTRIIASRTTRLLLIGAVAFIDMAYLLRVDGGWPALAIYGGAGWAFVRRDARADLRQ